MADDTDDYRPPPRDDADVGEAALPALVVAFQMLPGFTRPFALAPSLALGRGELAAAARAAHGTAIEDPTVSRLHLTLERSQGGEGIFSLRCESPRGAWINGWRLEGGETAKLFGGEIIRVGGTVLAYVRSLLPSADERPFGTPDDDLEMDRAVVVAPFGLRALRWDLRHLRARVAASRIPRSVLIQGETGTGKEHLARAVAAALGRRGVEARNVAAIPRDLVSAELFGVRKGAFTGAEATLGAVRDAAKTGRALFLDEIGDLSLDAQATLLRFLQSGDVQTVGGPPEASTAGSSALVPVIFATHRDLAEMVRKQTFREDLLARIQERIVVPPVRERSFDALAIVTRLWPGEVVMDRLPAEAIEHLLLARHPENVRGLERLVHEAARRPTRRLTLDDAMISRVIPSPGEDDRRAALCPSAVRAAYERATRKPGRKPSAEAAHRWLLDRAVGSGFSEGTFTRYAKALGL